MVELKLSLKHEYDEKLSAKISETELKVIEHSKQQIETLEHKLAEKKDKNRTLKATVEALRSSYNMQRQENPLKD